MDLICKWCGETKPEDLFVRRVTSAPYSQSNVKCCRQCWSVYQKERYKRPEVRAKQLRANAEWRKAHPDEMARYARKLNAERPNQLRARTRVNSNIRRGYWTRKPCEVCGAQAAEAHHDSYAEPHWETVRWLCKDHHEAWHTRMDPVRDGIAAEPLAEVESLRQDAIRVQEQISELRQQFRALNDQANALELATWNRVVEAVQPLYLEFLK